MRNFKNLGLPIFYPKSVIRLYGGFRAAVRQIDLAGYIEKKQEARCRQQCGKRLKSQLKLTVDSLTLFGGLMTVLGLCAESLFLHTLAFAV